MIGTVLVILFVSSFSTINNSIQPIKAVTAEVENNEDEETAYLKFASQAIKQSDNSSAINATIQLPEAAKGPPIPAKGYLVQQIGDGLYWLTDGAYQTMFMVTAKGVVAVDAPAELQRAKSVAKNASMVPPIPTVTFIKNHTLQIGNQSLKLDYYGVNHSPGNIFIYAPKQKVLMLVDVIFPGWVPFPYLAIAKDTAGFIKAHDIALNNYDFDTLVGGHLTRLGTRNDAIVQREFVSDLEKAAAQANQQVSFGEIAKQVGGGQPNPWLIFSKYIDAVGENCVNSMLPKWENRLGGAQQFMSTHCFTMAQSGRIDPTVQALLQNSTFVYK